ncbi:MAG: response regulator [Nitrospinae bacterium]|nr:response regulator [Nitrospinota bacterium]
MGQNKVLVADDSVTIQKVFELAFESEGVEILLASDGRAALDMARKHMPSIIIADVNMPEMDGFDLCRFIKKESELTHIPVYLLSSALDDFDDARAAQAGAAGRFEKPFRSEEMVKKVMAAVKEAEAKTHAMAASANTEDTFEDIDVSLENILESVSKHGPAETGYEEDADSGMDEERGPEPVVKILELSAEAISPEDGELEDELAVETVSGDEEETVAGSAGSFARDPSATEPDLSDILELKRPEGAVSPLEAELPADDENLSEEALRMLAAIDEAVKGGGAMEPQVKPERAVEGVSDERLEGAVGRAVAKVLEDWTKSGHLKEIMLQHIHSTMSHALSGEQFERMVDASVRRAVDAMEPRLLETFRKVAEESTLSVAENLVRQTIEQIKSGD